MAWARQYIQRLKKGGSIKFRPHGGMSGKIETGQLVTVAPTGEQQFRIGDVVLCPVNGIQSCV